MARLRASSLFDMRIVVPSSASLAVATDEIAVIGGTRGTTVTGDIDVTATGVAGTVHGYSQVLGNALVFTASGIELSAATILDILQDRDNDRFLAYTLSGDDTISGSTGADYLIGFGGDDRVNGGAGSDHLFGGAGRDTVDGGSGNDYIAGGLDLDLMRGGVGNDTYLFAQVGDRVVESANAGIDTILSYVTIALPANVERLTLIGTTAIDAAGSSAADRIDGNDASNYIDGGAGADRIEGDGGADTIVGGAGADVLAGGTGADVFRFRSIAEVRGDRIVDFVHGQDRIALGLLDADTTHAGNQAFHFIGSHGFSGEPGELTASGTWLRGDVDGDMIADFRLTLDGDPIVTAADIIL